MKALVKEATNKGDYHFRLSYWDSNIPVPHTVKFYQCICCRCSHKYQTDIYQSSDLLNCWDMNALAQSINTGFGITPLTVLCHTVWSVQTPNSKSWLWKAHLILSFSSRKLPPPRAQTPQQQHGPRHLHTCPGHPESQAQGHLWFHQPHLQDNTKIGGTQVFWWFTADSAHFPPMPIL